MTSRCILSLHKDLIIPVDVDLNVNYLLLKLSHRPVLLLLYIPPYLRLHSSTNFLKENHMNHLIMKSMLL